jgi:SAM-dependent methyltransferase
VKFTGERVIPKQVNLTPLFEEHLARYFFAGEFVQGQCVLDLGCGTGYGSYYLSQKGAQFVLATDVDAEAIQYARLHYKAANLLYLQSNAINLPLAQQSFDLVISFEVIEHLQAVKTYLAEISRVLTDKGWLIGSTPNRLVYSMGAYESHNPFHWREYDPIELDLLLKEFFDSVFILGQRPFHGFVIGPVPINPNEASRAIEFLPENVRTERSIADSKYLVYLAGKLNAPNNQIGKHMGSCYYLGQPSSYHDIMMTAHIQSLQNDRSRIQHEYRKLETLIKGYQSGKFIRFMTMIHRWRSRIFSNRNQHKTSNVK